MNAQPRPAARWNWLWAALATAAILVVTLKAGDRPAVMVGRRCMLCDYGALSDVLANVLLFAPLGVAVARLGWWAKHTLLAGFGLSVAIELVQWQFMASRDGSVRDVISNTMGTGAGLLVLQAARAFRQPPAGLGNRLALLAAAAATLVVLLTGYLAQPLFPVAQYYGQWTPQFPHQYPYRGRVLDAALGGRPIASRALAHSDEVRSALLGGEVLRVRVAAGSPPRGSTTIFSIFDGDGRQIVTAFGARDLDLELHVRTRAAAARLIDPPLRVPGLLGGAGAGDTLELAAQRAGRGWCAGLAVSPRCGLGRTAGEGWKLIVNLPLLWRFDLLNAAWLAALLAPAGYWSRGWWLPAAALLLMAFGAPLAAGLLATPATQWAGAVGGLLLGRGVRRLADRSVARLSRSGGG